MACSAQWGKVGFATPPHYYWEIPANGKNLLTGWCAPARILKKLKIVHTNQYCSPATQNTINTAIDNAVTVRAAAGLLESIKVLNKHINNTEIPTLRGEFKYSLGLFTGLLWFDLFYYLCLPPQKMMMLGFWDMLLHIVPPGPPPTKPRQSTFLSSSFLSFWCFTWLLTIPTARAIAISFLWIPPKKRQNESTCFYIAEAPMGLLSPNQDCRAL